MLANFLIGLREGLEASLVVGILVAYLCRTGHRSQLRPLWIGVSAAITVSLGFGAVLYFTARELADTAEPIFAGLLGVVAVGFVTYMVFWMRSAARHMKSDLEGKLSAAVRVGALALAAMAFIAVAREGLETALFLWSNIENNTGAGPGPLFGAVLGITTAVGLEYLLYRSALKLNLAKFFRVTGALLVVVAAGVLAGAVGALQEASWLPGQAPAAFDVTAAVPEDSWYGVLLKGLLGFRPDPNWLMLAAWAGYLLPVMTLFLRSGPVRRDRGTPPARTVAAPQAVNQD